MYNLELLQYFIKFHTEILTKGITKSRRNTLHWLCKELLIRLHIKPTDEHMNSCGLGKKIKSPKTGSILETLDKIYEAGGKAWDDIEDPKSLKEK